MGDSKHANKNVSSGGAPIGGVYPSRSLLEVNKRILEKYNSTWL